MGQKIRMPSAPHIQLERDQHGVIHITSRDQQGLYQGMGYAHILDRSSQMLLMRILGRGEGCLYLDDSDEMLEIDRFFRRMNWRGYTSKVSQQISERSRNLCQAYCDGVNQALKEHPSKLFKLLGYQPEPWTLEDSVLLSRMAGYLTLAQSQGELERFIIEMIQADVSEAQLEELFPGQLQGLDLNLIKKLTLHERLVPDSVIWQQMVAPMLASNNWVIAPERSATGQAILATDPHLEGNRLPNVWYEIVLQTEDRYALCATMPGLPGLLLGRNNDLAWGVTYTFMDTIDSWIEDCRDGLYRREDIWLPFKQRTEVIQRKKHKDVTLTFYENDHGVLDGNPHEPGYYLSTRWSADRSGVSSFEAIQDMWHISDVARGMPVLGQLESSWNWVLADRQGNIGYQMSGLMPKRRAGISGLIPLPGWDSKNDWSGFVSPKNLPRAYNPEEGFFVTANNDLNAYGKAKPINAPMGACRAERIAELLNGPEKISLEDCQNIQQDTYSRQAQVFMEMLLPLLPDNTNAEKLKHWDFHYRPEAVEPWLFEQIYQALFKTVFGAFLGSDVMNFLTTKTGVLADFYGSFDTVLLAEESLWFKGKSRDELYEPIIAQALEAAPQNWGSSNQFTLSNILLGGKLPRWAKVDRGPIPLKGGRATPHQGQIYRSGERMTSFMPALRFITDLGTDSAQTCLLGGPSDFPLSKWYASDLDNWRNGKYKTIAPIKANDTH